MKLTCPRKEFFEAVTLAASASSGRTPANLLQNLRIVAEDQQVKILGCDNEIWLERTAPCLVEKPGAVCVQASLLKDIVASLPDGDIELQVSDDQGVLLTQGHSEYRMLSVDATDFPEVPNYGGEAEVSLPFAELRAAIDSVIFAVSSETHRQVLTGVMMQYDGNSLTLAATDTHRLAVHKVEKPGIGGNLSAVVPEKALRAIKGLPVADDTPLELRFGDGRMGVDTGTARMVTQLLSGAYPNWERVVPSESTREWSLEVDQLNQKVRRALIVARDSANRLRFIGQSELLTIVARSDEKGEAKEEVDVIGKNGDIEIAFNGKYVQDALGVIRGPGVRVQMTENGRPAIFRPADDDQDYFCVIMPMALN